MTNIERLLEEIERFKKYMLSEEKEYIYEHFYEIFFYETMKFYFEYNKKFEEKLDYASMYQLYEFYIQHYPSDVSDDESVEDFLNIVLSKYGK